MTDPIILGIDPGFAIIGWAVINHKKEILDYGSITTSSDLPIHLRMLEIAKDLESLYQKYRPTHLAIEKLFYFKNAKTIINVAQTKGMIIYLAASHHLSIHQYTPLQIKITIAGYGKATKKQVQTMTTRLFGLSSIPKPDDVADALAIAYTHLVYSKNPQSRHQNNLV
ncbi:MAG: crossover junction endodeoxyribonuclease RuvC [bacterium]|nr:crossover junction endodeoxyribonuclease RuvC [bacterium]